MTLCELCGSERAAQHIAREMMFGMHEEFTYLECSECGRLRISPLPSHLDKYYPSFYTAYSAGPSSPLKARLRQSIVSLAIRRQWLLKAVPRAYRFQIARLVHSLRLRPDMSILDVGCGAGLLVRDLRAAGFTAFGIDRFAPQVSDAGGIAVKQCELQDLSEHFDSVLFNHSLEHIDDQVGTLRLALSRLRPGGMCVVRIPVAAWAWQEYGTDWVQLDPPRHLVVHSEKSFRLAVELAGFTVSDIVYDSFDFQFWGSELYRMGVPLETARPHLHDYFSKTRMKEFARRAEELNRESQGDQAIFFLRPAQSGR